MFTVRKELTPSANGDTKCSVYLQKKLDYEIHASYIMQIIAEVKCCKLGVWGLGLDNYYDFKPSSPSSSEIITTWFREKCIINA